VKSAKQKMSLTLKENADSSVIVLSVSREGQLLVGQRRHLHVHSANCSHVTSIKLPDDDSVCDAVWTPGDKIVYSEGLSDVIVTMSQSGDVIQRTNVSWPTYLSVSTDGVIYLISAETSVYQSTDDGLTWSLMLNVTDGLRCYQVIKVSTDSTTDVLWTLVLSPEDWLLRVYTIDKRRVVGDNVTWRDSHYTQ
jgi:hypothetical protein